MVDTILESLAAAAIWHPFVAVVRGEGLCNLSMTFLVLIRYFNEHKIKLIVFSIELTVVP